MKPTGISSSRIWVATALLALAGCSAKAPAPVAPPAAPAEKFDATARVQWYQQCWGYFNDKKWDDFAQCYAADAISQQSGYGKAEVMGAADIVASAQQLTTLAPDVRGEQQLILVNADHHHLVSLSVLHGTNSGPMKDASGKERKPTGKPFGYWFGHSVELANDVQAVTREFGVSDSGTMAAQLGLSKAPARAVLAAPAGPAQVIVANRGDATEKQNYATEMDALEAWNKHDAGAIEALQTDDYVAHDASYAKDMNRAENTADNKNYWAGFSDARLGTSSVWAVGPYVVIEGRFEGTSNGDVPALKLKKTGRKVELPLLQIDRFANGKIAETWLIYDSGSFAAQLNAPLPK